MASAGECRVATADRFDTALGLLPILLAAKGGQVEQGVGADERVGTPAVGRVGVEDLLAVTEEAAEAGEFGGLLVAERPGDRTVVVVDQAAVRVQGDTVVVVELAAETGVPGEGPAALLGLRRDLVVGGAGGQHEVRLAGA